MEKEYCTSCGNSTTKNDSFCFKCGAKMDSKKDTSKEHYLETQNDIDESKNYIQPKRKIIRNTVQLRKGIMIPLIIIGVLAIPTIAYGVITSARQDLGILTYEIPIGDITHINLDINNDIGSIVINYDKTITNLFEAKIMVQGGLRASFFNAQNFIHVINNESAEVSFYYKNPTDSFIKMKSITHNIILYLHPCVSIDFEVRTSTGNIICYTEDIDNLVINDLHLTSSTGSVKFIGRNLLNTTFGEIQLESSTGSLIFDLGASRNTIINSLTLECSTGSITTNLGKNIFLLSPEVVVSTSTGSITLMYNTIITEGEINWNLSTSTGSIYLQFSQTDFHEGNVTMNFNLETSTGSITIDYNLSNEIGIQIEASTNTGSINLPNGNSYYISSNFYQKASQYFFKLSASTGSIAANGSN